MADNVNKVLIVEQDDAVVDLVERVAKEAGFAVASAASVARFVQLLESFQPSLVVVEPNLPGSDAGALFTTLAARAHTANVLLIGNGDLASAHSLGVAKGLAMCGTLEKPLAAAELATKLIAMVHRSAELYADDLRRGLGSGELVPYYQPKATRTAGGWVIDGVEALARWHHPRRGLVMPNEFIPLAEQTSLIAELTATMLDAALRQVRTWQQQGLRLTCAVNLPPGLFTDLGFPDRVAALLADSGVDGSQLVLEITETATIQNPTATMAILTRLRVKGVGLALDDFGTGFSSMTQLFEMPFSELKIDKSLVMNMPQSPEATTMIASLIELGHNLGLKICAEGVESRAALDALTTMGCDRCQGYFISGAIPASEIAAFAARWNKENNRVPAKSRRKGAR
ncbi:MAG TPA: EAL domain-containing protein [Gammaproteobacteria bacterium]|nr:EAL domain-containing protein [Gammaproteobacteria bacterium]